MFVPNWLLPKYDDLEKAERSVMTASGIAWLAAIVDVCAAVYGIATGQALSGSVAGGLAVFWAVAGWRIREFSAAWATSAAVVFALGGALLVVQRRFGALGSVLVLVFMFGFRTNPKSPSKPLRMSVAPAAR